MLQVLSDANEKDGVFCIAGVAFGIDRAKSAEKAWRALYGGRVAHMASLLRTVQPTTKVNGCSRPLGRHWPGECDRLQPV